MKKRGGINIKLRGVKGCGESCFKFNVVIAQVIAIMRMIYTLNPLLTGLFYIKYCIIYSGVETALKKWGGAWSNKIINASTMRIPRHTHPQVVRHFHTLKIDLMGVTEKMAKNH